MFIYLSEKSLTELKNSPPLCNILSHIISAQSYFLCPLKLQRKSRNSHCTLVVNTSVNTSRPLSDDCWENIKKNKHVCPIFWCNNIWWKSENVQCNTGINQKPFVFIYMNEKLSIELKNNSTLSNVLRHIISAQSLSFVSFKITQKKKENQEIHI